VSAGVGHEVLIGVDYPSVPAWHTEERKLIGNAVYLGANAAGGTWRVMGFDPFAAPSASTVDGIVVAQATSHGVGKLQLSHAKSVAGLLAGLSKKTVDTVVVYDASTATAPALAAAGEAAGPSLAAFAKAGGVVIVIASATGSMGVFVTQANLAPVVDLSPVSPSASLLNVAPGDAVGLGVSTFFAASNNTAGWMMADATPAFLGVVDAPGARPVVLHAVVHP
jgi:hypothetical protein